MAGLQDLRDFLSLDPRGQSDGGPGRRVDTPSKNQGLWVTPGNLTFPALTVVGGTLINAVAGDIGNGRLIWVIIVGLIFGGFLTYLALSDSKNTAPRSKVIEGFVGVVNTALMMVAMFGVASI